MSITLLCTIISAILCVLGAVSYVRDNSEPFYLFCAICFGIATIGGSVLIALN